MPIGYIEVDTPTDHILTEDGKLVGVGDWVWCYYDGFWAQIVDITDTHASACDTCDLRNQVLWANVKNPKTGEGGSYNGQRMAIYDPKGTKP